VEPGLVHPDDLAALGLADGDLVRIRSRHDAIAAVVEADASLASRAGVDDARLRRRPGSDDDPRVRGSNAGRLLRADDDYDPVSGIPRMGALPVAVEPLRDDTPAAS
jgi:anaerobic selenocysteine-containing dehydrogenase